jgi:type 1 glutamine amidotransferase
MMNKMWWIIPMLLCAGSVQADGKIRAVVITGGHAFETAEFRELFDPADAVSCDLRIPANLKTPAPEEQPSRIFDDIGTWPYNVIVLYNFRNELNETQRGNFLKLLDRGVGLVVLHHAIAAYPDWPEFDHIIGARYYLQPETINGVEYARCTWKHGQDLKVHVEDNRHPISAGLQDFSIHDEAYKGWSYFEGNHLLLSTDHPLNNSQLAWTRTYGKTRVACIQLGHGPEAYADKNFRRLVSRAMQWVAGKEGDL